jgi:hypothetical protein
VKVSLPFITAPDLFQVLTTSECLPTASDTLHVMVLVVESHRPTLST